MTRTRPFLALALLALSASLLVADPAAADCSGPTIEYDAGEVQPGGTVTVRGSAWGDECYDTGPPPDGEGVLGRPIEDIAIVVEQGPVAALVAIGSADDDYEFEVEVTMPPSILPGEARVRAFWARGIVFDATDATVVVTGEAPPDLVELSPVRFGPTEEAEADTMLAPDEDSAVDGGAAAPTSGDADDLGSGASNGDPLFVLWLVLAAAGGAAVAMAVCLRGRTSVTTADQLRGTGR
ncbi:hypothetical protein [Actinomarinicola tropica]|uniref:IPT/TIG domain-containing protein n=1 Tax=Actinomarinicola tropica TaxID=2789776 RepID=A0A5Q2RNU6_9ACTN|nr:hypothetical protein [Actinomarinicola tropica]QGG95767.1 hypothetical protein GH723_12040 [Actinomarinicola tropica]